MLTLRQSAFDRTAFDRLESDLFKRLEQQLHTAERVPAAEVRETEASYSICLELPGVERDTIDVKATDRNLVISAERRAPQAESTDGDPQPWLTDTSAKLVATERVSADWVGREP